MSENLSKSATQTDCEEDGKSAPEDGSGFSSLPEARRCFSPAISQLADVVGTEKALEIGQTCQGLTLYVPQLKNVPGSTLEKLIGLEAAELLAKHYAPAGVKVEIPSSLGGSTAWRRRVGLSMLRQGASIRDVCRKLGVASSTVKLWRKQL